MSVERRGPAICNTSAIGAGKDEMTKASIDLQDLRRRIYVKAKAEPAWRFWGLYVHVCKMETLRAAYEMARQNDGARGVEGVPFEAIEAQGVEALLEQLRDELTERRYEPLPARKQEIPKDGGKVRVLSIPAIRDRVVQGALKLILEPVFEADFQPGSFGYRPKRTAHGALKRVAEAIVQRKTRVLDFDLRAYFDNVRHDRLLEKVAQRVEDADVMHLLKTMLKASGKKGVPQGGVISPLLSNTPRPPDPDHERTGTKTRAYLRILARVTNPRLCFLVLPGGSEWIRTPEWNCSSSFVRSTSLVSARSPAWRRSSACTAGWCVKRLLARCAPA